MIQKFLKEKQYEVEYDDSLCSKTTWSQMLASLLMSSEDSTISSVLHFPNSSSGPELARTFFLQLSWACVVPTTALVSPF